MRYTMKKIGFIDYYLSEWHANNYVKWFREESEKLGLDYAVTYAWAELEKSPENGVTTDEWCEKYSVTRCDTVRELCELSDVIVILSPDNPEKHLEYAAAVLPCKKRTYIDKTFAPDYETALKIFAIAEENGTPFFSTSALRFATELDAMESPIHITTTGGGLFERYIVHQAEMIIKKLKAEPISAVLRVLGTSNLIDISFKGGKSATIVQDPTFGFSASMTDADVGRTFGYIESPFFRSLISNMVTFFETGEVCFDTNETKQVIKLVELCIKAKDNPKVIIEA